MINPSELERLKEKKIRDYDQNLTALARLERNIENLLADESSSVEEKLKLYNILSAKFENLHSKFNKTTRDLNAPVILAKNLNDQPVIEIAPRPLSLQEELELAPAAQPEELQQPAVAPKEDALQEDNATLNVDEMLTHIPSQYHPKFNKLMDIVKQYPGELSRSPNNCLIISGKVIPDTSFIDLFRALYVHSTSHCNIGQNQFLQALAKCNIDPNLISNTRIRTHYLKLLNPSIDIQTGTGPPPGKRPCILMLYKS